MVSLYNSHYDGVRFGAEASEWLSCLSGSLPKQLYCSSPRAVLIQTETLACTPLVAPPPHSLTPASLEQFGWKDIHVINDMEDIVWVLVSTRTVSTQSIAT